MDLVNGIPRSPYESMHGIVFLPRAIDKVRAEIAGTLGDYISRHLLLRDAAGVPGHRTAGLCRRRSGPFQRRRGLGLGQRKDDAPVGHRDHGVQPSNDDEDAGRRHGARAYWQFMADIGQSHRTDLTRQFDRLDLDEDRDVPWAAASSPWPARPPPAPDLRLPPLPRGDFASRSLVLEGVAARAPSPRGRGWGEGLPGNRPRVTQRSLKGELGSLGRRPGPRALARLVPKAAWPPKSTPLRPSPAGQTGPSRIPGQGTGWTHAQAEWTHVGWLAGKVDTSGRRVDTFGRKTEHIRAKTEHLAENTVNTCAGRGMPRDANHRSPQRQSERRHPRPDHTQPCPS